jgi:hypothetical protein
MNIDELKTVWQQYNQRTERSIELNEKMILGMIKDRSSSLLSKMKRQYMFIFIYLAMVAVFCIACLAGNAFDYTTAWSYIPLAAYTVCLGFFLLLMIKGYNMVDINLSNANLKEALSTIIIARKKHKALTSKVVLLIMFFGTMFPVAHLPKVLQTRGWVEAVGLGVLPVITIVLIYWIAKKLGAFNDRFLPRLQDNLEELEQLSST